MYVIAVPFMDRVQNTTFNRLRVAFNNAYQRILDLHGVIVPVVCMQLMYNLEAVIRQQTFGFVGIDYAKVVAQLYKPMKGMDY